MPRRIRRVGWGLARGTATSSFRRCGWGDDVKTAKRARPLAAGVTLESHPIRSGRTRMCWRSTLVGTLLVALVVAACRAHPTGVVTIRNDSSAPITMRLEWPGGLPLGLFGANDVTVSVPPWQPGWCSTAGVGVFGAPVTVTVAGASLTDTFTFTASADAVERGAYYLHVDRAGEVRTEPARAQQYPCLGYPTR